MQRECASRKPMDDNYIFENMPIHKALMKLALPAVFSQIMLVIYNMADTFFISITQSNAKIAAVALCMPSLMVFNAIANLFGVGAASVISRALGKSDIRRAKDACAFSFWGCMLATISFSALSMAFANPITDFLGGINPEIHKYSLDYIKFTTIYCGWTISIPILMSHIVRSEGHSVLASIGIVSGGIINIMLDPLLMFVILDEGNEVAGAAIATSLSNVISFCYYMAVIAIMRKKKKAISMKLRKSCFERSIPRCILGAGLPAFAMTFAENLSYAVLDRLMATAGTIFQAGIAVAKKINMLSHSIIRGLTQGALPLLGYAYSTGNRMKTKRIAYLTLSTAFVISTLILAANLIFTSGLVSLFLSPENPSGGYAADFLKILALGCPTSAIAYAFISFFQAVGHGKESLVLALMRKGMLDIPLMFILQLIITTYGIVWATPITDAICCIASVIAFVRFSERHLKKNKRRKTYDPKTDTYIIKEPCDEQP